MISDGEKREILRKYRLAEGAKQQKEQILIESQLHGCDIEEIKKILMEQGAELPMERRRNVKVKAEKEIKTNQTEGKTIPDAVKECLFRRMEKLTDQIDEKTKEISEIKKFLNDK